MKRSCTVSAGAFLASVIALVAAGGFWLRHEEIEFERRMEESRTGRVAMWIDEAKQTRMFHSGYDTVSAEEWKRVGDLGPLRSVSQSQTEHVDGRAMLAHVDAESINLTAVRLEVGEPERYPTNASVTHFGLTKVSVEGDLAPFLAAMPRLESVSVVRVRFGENVDEADVLIKGLVGASDLKSIAIDDERIADRLRERFPDVELKIDRRSDDEIYP